jgi:hypothetical protein
MHYIACGYTLVMFTLFLYSLHWILLWYENVLQKRTMLVRFFLHSCYQWPCADRCSFSSSFTWTEMRLGHLKLHQHHIYKLRLFVVYNNYALIPANLNNLYHSIWSQCWTRLWKFVATQSVDTTPQAGRYSADATGGDAAVELMQIVVRMQQLLLVMEVCGEVSW